MSTAEILDAIADDIRLAERSPEMARHLALDHGPQMLAGLRAVLDLHKPVPRFLVDGFEERTYRSREEVVEATECDPGDVTEWKMCAECARIEDGPDGTGPSEVGYANADHPCPTVRAVEAALGATS
ncbi:hypothetical protein G6031_09485 [Dietzia sp. CQ4]|uniref:hypothetical protein n=1 Tax=Dietzia sp. (strain CQ4) TaxID=370437 RepID=UPI0015FABDE8|nr:hypothetical protein [Dietzia sp. CQ4]MBB1034619.1 hypothetical protein [Dietzia sp. CQ4]